MRVKVISLAAMVASLYAVGTVALTPIAYGLVQVRLTDALIALSFIPEMGWGVVLGVTLGNLVANAFSPYGFPDLILGTVANFLASCICMIFGRAKVRHGLLLGTLASSVVIALVVGAGLLYGIYRVASPGVCFLAVLAGELISVVLVGSMLVKALLRTKAIEKLVG